MHDKFYVTGDIKCENTDSIRRCQGILVRYRLHHTTKDNVIRINSRLMANADFRSNIFRDHLLKRFSEFGTPAIEIVTAE